MHLTTIALAGSGTLAERTAERCAGSHAALAPRVSALRDIDPDLEFAPLADLGLRLLEQMDPKTHHFLMAGRSPYPFSAFANLVVPRSATDVPISYRIPVVLPGQAPDPHGPKRHIGPLHTGVVTRTTFDLENMKLKTEEESVSGQREALFRHFDQVFPSRESLGDKALVLVDVIHEGPSLANFAADVHEYLKVRGISNPVKIVPIVISDIPEKAERGLRTSLQKLGINDPVSVLTVTSPELRELLTDEALKPRAPQTGFDLSRLQRGVAPHRSNRSRYVPFGRALEGDFEAALEKDPQFQQRVQRLRP